MIPNMRLFAFLIGAVIGEVTLAGPLTYPESPRRPAQETLHGTVIDDDYRWLEQVDSGEVTAWVAAQNRLTREVIDAMPRRQAIKRELLRMLGQGRVSRSGLDVAGGRLFALKRQPPRNQNSLVMMDARATLSSERVVLDPNHLDVTG